MSVINIIKQVTYKPGYIFDAEIHNEFVNLYRVTLSVQVQSVVEEQGVVPISVAKWLPKSAMDALDGQGLRDVIVGLAIWWEMHEMGEWLKLAGDPIVDVDVDHHPGHHHGLDTYYADMQQLQQLGEFVYRRYGRMKFPKVDALEYRGDMTWK